MICRNCGKKNKEYGKFCIYCGNNLQENKKQGQANKEVNQSLGLHNEQHFFGTPEEITKQAVFSRFKTTKFLLFVISTIFCSLTYLIFGIGMFIINSQTMGMFAIVFLLTFLPLVVTSAISAIKGLRVYRSKTPLRKEIRRIGILGDCEKIVGILWILEAIALFKLTENANSFICNPIFLIGSGVIAILAIPAGKTISHNFNLLEEIAFEGKDKLDKLLPDVIIKYNVCVLIAPIIILWIFCIFMRLFTSKSVVLIVVFMTVLTISPAIYYGCCFNFFRDVTENVRPLIKENLRKKY